MKNIVIFEGGRGSRAKLIKRGNKRVLIEFTMYDYDTDEDKIVTEWFNLYIPSYASDKKLFKHNNKRKHASYCHNESNEFYCDFKQSDEFKADVAKYYTKDYYGMLYELN